MSRYKYSLTSLTSPRARPSEASRASLADVEDKDFVMEVDGGSG